MITINTTPLSVNTLFEGSLREKTLTEDEWEEYHHGFVVEIAIDQTREDGFSLALHWLNTQPANADTWELAILQRAADDLSIN